MKPMFSAPRFAGRLAACLAACALLPGAASAQQDTATPGCGPDGRCAASVQLKTDKGELFGTIGVQTGKDGSAPIAFALVPLGVALRPGARIVMKDAGEVTLGFDACFPDGCRATADLTADQLAALAGASDLSLQFFALQSDRALSGEASGAALGEGLRKAGVTLP